MPKYNLTVQDKKTREVCIEGFDTADWTEELEEDLVNPNSPTEVLAWLKAQDDTQVEFLEIE